MCSALIFRKINECVRSHTSFIAAQILSEEEILSSKTLHIPKTPWDKLSTKSKEADLNFDGELDREEFVEFINHIAKDIIVTVGQGLIITLAVAPAVALLTKRTTENVPGVGKVVQKVPNSVYASLVTLVVVMFQQEGAKKA